MKELTQSKWQNDGINASSKIMGKGCNGDNTCLVAMPKCNDLKSVAGVGFVIMRYGLGFHYQSVNMDQRCPCWLCFRS